MGVFAEFEAKDSLAVKAIVDSNGRAAGELWPVVVVTVEEVLLVAKTSHYFP